jgi:hypothetical protein
MLFFWEIIKFNDNKRAHRKSLKNDSFSLTINMVLYVLLIELFGLSTKNRFVSGRNKPGYYGIL